MNNRKYKIVVNTTSRIYSFDSNSRNARKHLFEQNACIINVYDAKSGDEISRAMRFGDKLIMHGAVKQN